jgi:hypothetical protein
MSEMIISTARVWRGDRSGVAAILAGTAPAPTLIPAVEPAAQPGASAARPTLRRPSTDELVLTNGSEFLSVCRMNRH